MLEAKLLTAIKSGQLQTSKLLIDQTHLSVQAMLNFISVPLSCKHKRYTKWKTLDYTQFNDGQTVRVPVYALSSSEFKLVMVRKRFQMPALTELLLNCSKWKNINHAETTLEIVPR
ncbi:hypothetical protein PO124_15260 [Bacillus licheniformis]|nr:hypothetical protein [Bacillus licheniformis]